MNTATDDSEGVAKESVNKQSLMFHRYTSNYGPITSEKVKLTDLNIQKFIFSKVIAYLKVHCAQDSLYRN